MPAVDTAQGLSTSQAAQMLLRHGPNRLSARKRVLAPILLHFRNPLVLVLMAASAISALTREEPGSIVIAWVVLLSVTLDFAPMPPMCFALLAALVPCYLATVECAKPWFYRRLMRS
ncbi:MAG: hypothetical protein EBY24_15610 [Betaproteobacteria bacterium]|nr:hypothetical protein [Betaproteobacteria bacterium]